MDVRARTLGPEVREFNQKLPLSRIPLSPCRLTVLDTPQNARNTAQHGLSRGFGTPRSSPFFLTDRGQRRGFIPSIVTHQVLEKVRAPGSETLTTGGTHTPRPCRTKPRRSPICPPYPVIIRSLSACPRPRDRSLGPAHLPCQGVPATCSTSPRRSSRSPPCSPT